MKKLLAFIFLTSLVVYAGLPPTSLKGGNEASLQTTFQFDLGQIPVTRTGTNVVFGTIPVTQGGTSQTTLTQYGLLAGNGTAAVQSVSPGASGTILFSNGASAFPSYRLLASSDITTSLGYTPLASTTAAIISTLGYTPLNRANNLSDLASSATARTNLGLGSLATKSVIDLGSGDVTGTTSVVNGGTGLSSTVAQGVLVGSGATSYRIASPASAGAVLMQSVSGTTAFLQPQPINVGNLLINGGFETYDSSTGSFYGWSSSSSGDIGNWTSPSQWDLKYWRHIDTTFTLGTDIFQTVTIPSSLYGQNCEFGFDYTNTNTSGTVTRSWYVSGTSTVSGTFSSSGTSSIKAFLPCGTASDTTKVVNITTTNASASGVTSVDNVYFGPAKSLANGAIVGPWTAYTPTTQGLGTPTNVNFKWRQNGSSIDIEGYLQTGTTTGVEARIGLPNNFNTTSKYVNVAWVVGDITRGAISAQTVYLAAQASKNYLVVTIQSSGAAGSTPVNGNTAFGSSENLTFKASVEIEGLNGTGVTYESRCPNDISCANEFSAKISGTTVTSENLDWISSVGLTDTSLYTITFNSGVFTDAPNCVANASRVGIPSTTMSIESVTSSTVAVRGRGDTGALQATDFFVQCNKSTDYVAKKTITGYLSNTVTTSGQYLERMERVKFAGNSTGTTNCTTSPCTIISQSGGISSVTRNSTGNYTLNFPSGNFSQAASCTGRAISVGVVAIVYVSEPGNILGTPTAVTVGTYNSSSGAAIDASVDVICMGPR